MIRIPMNQAVEWNATRVLITAQVMVYFLPIGFMAI